MMAYRKRRLGDDLAARIAAWRDKGIAARGILEFTAGYAPEAVAARERRVIALAAFDKARTPFDTIALGVSLEDFKRADVDWREASGAFDDAYMAAYQEVCGWDEARRLLKAVDLASGACDEARWRADARRLRLDSPARAR